MTDVKICGIKTPEALKAATENGARFIGFVFHRPSPRNVSFDTAWNLARAVPTGVRSIGLFVNPDDEVLQHITSGIPLDMIQLHGQETPERVAQIKESTAMPVIKAISIAAADDLNQIAGYEAVADWLLFDTKTTDGASGGTGQSFDWQILSGRTFKRPWMLAGGLNEANVAAALSILKPDAVDVSSGVETEPGVKDAQKIKKLINAVKSNA